MREQNRNRETEEKERKRFRCRERNGTRARWGRVKRRETERQESKKSLSCLGCHRA
jgi:hypothetical protein